MLDLPINSYVKVIIDYHEKPKIATVKYFEKQIKKTEIESGLTCLMVLTASALW